MESAATVRQRLTAAIGERYEVFDPIGAGGMATVFLSRHRMHGGFCAVKVLADHLASQEPLVKSFLTEAQASASLDAHPNIVNVVDIDQRDGLYYMIMKYVEGEDLSSYLSRKGRLPWRQAAYVAEQVADALAFAHDRGVIHRDLKPSNIRIGMHGGVTVLDFGIAKIGQTPSSFTEMGARAGTPHYMAPEQIRGQSVDHRSDLYSLGVMLYQMATGQKPFDGENREAIWYAHAAMEPATPREIAPDIPEALSHIILSLLAKDPANRYESAARVARHLRTLGLEDASAELEPVDQLHVEELRTRTLTPTLTPSSERTPSGASGATAAHTQADAKASAPAEPSGSGKLMLFAAAAVLIVLAGVAWAILGGSSNPQPAPKPAVVETPSTPPPAPEPTPEPEPEPAAQAPVQPAPKPPASTPAQAQPDDQEAARQRAAEEARRRRAAEARRQAEIEAAKARLRGEAAKKQQ
ncbi:MAG: serine/threonine protein kinase [Bryobacterales bacterium]|nr:serine/threonine protein kinase [Bryobacterales bacterium]